MRREVNFYNKPDRCTVTRVISLWEAVLILRSNRGIGLCKMVCGIHRLSYKSTRNQLQFVRLCTSLMTCTWWRAELALSAGDTKLFDAMRRCKKDVVEELCVKQYPGLQGTMLHSWIHVNWIVDSWLAAFDSLKSPERSISIPFAKFFIQRSLCAYTLFKIMIDCSREQAYDAKTRKFSTMNALNFVVLSKYWSASLRQAKKIFVKRIFQIVDNFRVQR